jgi:antitoxin component YwqK of YwqJK toxin-antitoxin module
MGVKVEEYNYNKHKELDGAYRTWRLCDGSLDTEFYYRDGKKHGTYKYFHKNGKARIDHLYEDDKLISRTPKKNKKIE